MKKYASIGFGEDSCETLHRILLNMHGYVGRIDIDGVCGPRGVRDVVLIDSNPAEAENYEANFGIIKVQDFSEEEQGGVGEPYLVDLYREEPDLVGARNIVFY